MADVEVGIEIKAVPDGFLSGAKGEKNDVVISFVLMPTPLARKDGFGVSLANWPQQIAQLTKYLQVRANGAKVESIVIDLPTIDSQIRELWAAALGLSDRFGAVDDCVASVFQSSRSTGAPAEQDHLLRGQGNYSTEVYSAPAAEIAKTLSLTNGYLRYRQIQRFLHADENQKAATQSINPLSASAVQTTAIAALFGLRGTQSIREWQESKPRDRKTLSENAPVVDALRRIAWTGRQKPPPRIRSLANAEKSPSRLEFVDDAILSSNFAAGLKHEIDVSRETHRLTEVAVKAAKAFKSDLLNKSTSGDLDTETQYRIFSTAFGVLLNGPQEGERRQKGFAGTYAGYATEPGAVIRRIEEALLSGENDDVDHGAIRKGFTRPHDPVVALASYEFCMMPDRVEFERTLASMMPPENAGVAAAKEPDPSSPPIIRRLMGLLAYPDVARLFGLVIDVKVKRAAFAEIGVKESEFAVEGSFEPGPGISIPPPRPEQVVIPTVCLLTDTSFEPQSLFAKYTADNPSLNPAAGTLPADLREGHLQLRDKGFEFLTLDVNAALEGTTRAARNDAVSRENGEFATALESSVTTHRTTGLALVDRNIVLKAKLEQALAKLREASPEDGLLRNALFLEDLVSGYRFDVGTQENGNTSWRSLTNRDIEFPQIPPAKLKGPTNHSGSRERMNGYVRSVHREFDSASKPVAAVYETLATWRNWSLAVPAESQEGEVCEDDLRLEVTVSLPSAKELEKRLPRLRFGKEYMLGARYVLINGSSLSFNEAVENYARDAKAEVPHLTLPAYRFQRHEPIAAPDLFHVKGAGKQTKDKGYIDGIESYQTGLGTIIVGTNIKNETSPATRLLLAGAQPFQLCELHGMFDGLSKLPENSFAGLKTDPPIQPLSANANESFFFKKAAKPAPYYTDPLAQLMVIGFFKDGEPASAPEYPEQIVVNLLQGNRKWPNVRPVRLHVKHIEHAGPYNGSSQRAALRETGVADDGAIIVVAEIEPAEIVEARAWCIPRQMAQMNELVGVGQIAEVETLVRQHSRLKEGSPAAAAVVRLSHPLSDGGAVSLLSEQLHSSQFGELATSDAVNGIFASIPIHGLSHNTVMELIHAVEKPLLAPRIVNLWAVHEQMAAPESGTGSSSADPEDVVRESWRRFIKEHGLTSSTTFEGGLAKLRLAGVEGSRRVLLGGAIDFHRRSTSTLELNGKWLDYTKDIGPRRGADGKFEFVPVSKSFKLDPRKQLENIPYEINGDPTAGQFDLVFDELLSPRFLFHEFDGTHAKRIDISAVAISRFAKYFKDKPNYVPDVRRGDGQTSTLVIPSTRRPDKVAVASVSTALHEDGGRVLDISDATVGRTLLPLARKIAIRLDLGNNWFSSGFSEKLGVVLWPPNLFDTPSAHGEGLRRIDCLPKFATCWGRDPVRMTGDLPRLLPASAIVNCTAYGIARVPVPPEEDAQAHAGSTRQGAALPLAFVDCALALFEPMVDPDTGHFYVDIEVDPGNSYNAFVHLGLVRYQANSLHFNDYDLQASLPIECHVTVMPRRKLEARISDQGIILNYSGTGYAGTNAGVLRNQRVSQAERQDLTAKLDRLDVSRIDVSVLWRSRDREHSGIPVALRPAHWGGPRKIAEIADMPPTVATPGFTLGWEFQIDFTSPNNACPVCRDREQITVETPNEDGNFQIVIREYEHYLADEYNSDGMREPEHTFPSPEKFNSRLVRRVVSSFSVDVEREPSPPEGGKDEVKPGK
ncbi:hypothetical protein GR268_36640 [Rhizobium leguminosarum]|nr:hypothetical protein [Rhizobium leguminosarum]